MARQLMSGERGFTLIEVMISVVLLTFGLLAVASVLPTGLGLGLYGKDQTRATSLAQQRVEYIKAQSPAGSYLNSILGDYLTITTQYFDQNGGPTTLGSDYFDRDVQVQVWAWNGTQFVNNSYTYPSSGTPYVYRVSVAVSWNINGFSSFQFPVGKTHGKGKPKSATGPTGCVVNNVSVPTGQGCVETSTFISP